MADVVEYAHLQNLLSDSHFWGQVKVDFIKAVRPLFTELYLAGVEGALKVERRLRRAGKKDDAPSDPEYELLVNDPAFAEASALFITSYSENWWGALEESTRRSLAQIFLDARDEGWTLPEIEDKVGALFGPERASRIAVTETTRLFGAGAQASYRAHGIEQWEWRTAADGLVDAICQELEASGPYPMEQDFVPAHVNCRCWPVPLVAGEEQDTTGEAALAA